MNKIYQIKLLNDAVGCWLVATGCLCASLVMNQFRDIPVPLIYRTKAERLDNAIFKITESKLRKKESLVTEFKSYPERLSLEQFKDFVESKRGRVIDARPEIFHRLGHVPGAIALPRDDFESYYLQHRAILEEDKAQPLAIYCSGASCEDSELIEATFKKLGYTRISVFKGGWEEWTDAGFPEVAQ